MKQGKKAVLAYFASLEKEERAPLNEVKVLLVGDGAAGKTSLVKRLLGRDFDIDEPQIQGINIDDWSVEQGRKSIRVHLWDFGGQEIMHATHQFFLSKRSLYVLVLNGRRDEKTEYWLKHIESFGGDSPALVVLNKIDNQPGFEVNRKFLQEKYKNIKGFFRLSCNTGEGIDTFTQALESALFQVEMTNISWPASWFKVKTLLEKMDEPFISYQHCQEICINHKIRKKVSQNTLVDFLNDLGVILHFRELEPGDTHVLSPRWATEAVYIYVTGRQKRDYFSIIRKTIRDINDSFEKLKTTELVPLPDNPGITVEYEELTGYEAGGKTEIYIGKLRKAYSVSLLLDGIEKPDERKEHDYDRDPGKPYAPPPPQPTPEPENKFWKTVIYIAAIMTILAAIATIINSIL